MGVKPKETPIWSQLFVYIHIYIYIYLFPSIWIYLSIFYVSTSLSINLSLHILYIYISINIPGKCPVTSACFHRFPSTRKNQAACWGCCRTASYRCPMWWRKLPLAMLRRWLMSHDGLRCGRHHLTSKHGDIMGYYGHVIGHNMVVS